MFVVLLWLGCCGVLSAGTAGEEVAVVGCPVVGVVGCGCCVSCFVGATSLCDVGTCLLLGRM